MNAGATFAVATATYALNWYLTQDWITDWLKEVFKEASKGRDIDEREQELAQQYPLAHYLNLLSLMAIPVEGLQTQTEPVIELPQFRVIANRETNAIKPIAVDLILDVGNSRTCGILIEDHGQSGSGMRHNYVLKLRDLSAPNISIPILLKAGSNFRKPSSAKITALYAAVATMRSSGRLSHVLVVKPAVWRLVVKVVKVQQAYPALNAICGMRSFMVRVGVLMAAMCRTAIHWQRQHRLPI